MKCKCGCGGEVKRENKYIKGHNNKYINISLEDRFWKKVDIKSSDDCWEWVGSKFKNGYGFIRGEKRRLLTHRVSYQLTYGIIPQGQLVCHHCDNRLCCNPNHLFLGTTKDNLQDMISKGRWKCSDRSGELNSNCKLSEEEVVEIKRLYATGLHSYRSLGNIYHVTYGHIGKIINNKFRNKV